MQKILTLGFLGCDTRAFSWLDIPESEDYQSLLRILSVQLILFYETGYTRFMVHHLTAADNIFAKSVQIFKEKHPEVTIVEAKDIEHAISESDNFIALWDGIRQGGTWETITRVKRQHKGVYILKLVKGGNSRKMLDEIFEPAVPFFGYGSTDYEDDI